MSTPVTSLDRRFSDPEASPFSWPATKHEIEVAELFWLTTVRADGRPHVTPLVAVWVGEELHFATGADEQKAVNLRSNSHVVLTTGRSDWNDGVDIVLEGDARLATDQAVLEQVGDAFRLKWDGRWKYSAQDGTLSHPDGFAVEVYSVRPRKVFAFAKGIFGHTVHKFGN
jgi:hypothetical protein